MANIFVSYSRQDRKQVSPLVELLEAHGWSVWWDREINPGESFEELIDQQITGASVVVVVWSKNSIGSRWVRNEALEAMERDILVPVVLDDSKLPVAFRQTQAADFRRWPSRVDEAEMEHFISAIAGKLGAPRQRVQYFGSGSRPGMWFGRGGLALVGLLLTMMAGAAIYHFATRAQRNDVDTVTLAIMRMQTDSGSTEESFMADSVADEVAAVLDGVRGLRLINRLSSWEIPPGLTREEIADRLNVSYLLEGKVVTHGDRMEVSVELVDPILDEFLFKRSYSAAGDDLQLLRSEIAGAIVETLGLNGGDLDNRVARMQTTQDNRAFELYLRAKDLLRRTGERDQVTTARDLLIQATQRDPSFGAAFAGLCRANIALYGDVTETKTFEEAERACNRALTLNQRSAEMNLALGALYETSGQYLKAQQEYERALRIDPMQPDALSGVGSSLAAQGDLERAETAFLRSVEVQPGYWRSYNRLGWFYLQNGREFEAIDAFSRVTYLAPMNAWGFNNLGAARFSAGDFEGALREWGRANEIEPKFSVRSNMGAAYFYLRDFAAAVAMYETALELAPSNYRLWLNLAEGLKYLQRDLTAGTSESGLVRDAESAYRKALDFAAKEQIINPTQGAAVAAQAMAFAQLGEPALARSMIDKALKLSERDLDVLYDATLTYLSLGNVQESIRWLTRAVELGYPKAFVRQDPMLDALRGLPEFAALDTADAE